MYPNGIYFGLKGIPHKSTLGPKYILFGYMNPYTLDSHRRPMVPLKEPYVSTCTWTLSGMPVRCCSDTCAATPTGGDLLVKGPKFGGLEGFRGFGFRV